MRLAMIPTLFASVEASSIESTRRLQGVRATVKESEALTSCDDDRFPSRDILERTPHIALHLRVDTGRKFIYEDDSRIACGTSVSRLISVPVWVTYQ